MLKGMLNTTHPQVKREKNNKFWLKDKMACIASRKIKFFQQTDI